MPEWDQLDSDGTVFTDRSCVLLVNFLTERYVKIRDVFFKGDVEHEMSRRPVYFSIFIKKKNQELT